jgi:hypothetical protein
MSIVAGNLLRFLGAAVVFLASAAALNFVVDPLQLFRAARFYPAMYSNDTRVQNAGLIRSQSFDTLFMGTSLAIHFRQSDIDRALGGRSLKLSMTGSNAHEQSFVLAAALQPQVKRVIWEVDDWIFRDAPEIDSDPYLSANLYRRNLKGLAEYLFSGPMTKESLWSLARAWPPLRAPAVGLTTDRLFKFAIPHVDDIHALPRDADIIAHYNAKRAMADFVGITDPSRSAYLAEGYVYDAMVRNFEGDAIGLIGQHPDVRFDIYFPPYSILQFVAMRDAAPAALRIVYGFTGYAAQRLAKFPNVRLHDFRSVKQVTHDLDNYGDVIHHSPMVDRQVLSWLAGGDYVVDPAAPLASLEQLKAQVEAYQVKPQQE